MGREIRRVPADWEHPTRRGALQPLFDRCFEDEAREWLDKAIAWDNGTDPDCAKHKAKHPFYWQWSDMPPDPSYYRPKWMSEPMHYQVYETVSEGTPVTPHFATKVELIDWLVEHGDAWDQKRGHGGWNRKAAEDFVEREWAPSMIITNGAIYEPKDGIPT